MKKRLLTWLLLLTFVPGTAFAGKNLILPSYYKSLWQETDFALQSKPVTRVEKDDSTPGISYRYMFDSGMVVGGDFIIGPRNFAAIDGSFSGYINEYYYAVIVGYVFNRDGRFQPYIEGGLNNTQLSLHSSNGGPNAALEGNSYAYGVGVNAQFGRVIGMRVGYQMRNIDSEDDNDSRIKTAVDAFSLSLIIKF